MTTPDLKKSLAFYVDILGGRLAVGGDGLDLRCIIYYSTCEMENKEGDHSPEYFAFLIYATQR